MDILQAHIHWTYYDTQLLETRKQVEEVVWRQRKLRWLDALGRKAQGT